MINIDENYYIRTDELNYVLCTRGKCKKKEVLGYYSKLASLLKAVLGYWARDHFSKADAELVDAVKQIIEKQKEYERALDSLGQIIE